MELSVKLKHGDKVKLRDVGEKEWIWNYLLKAGDIGIYNKTEDIFNFPAVGWQHCSQETWDKYLIKVNDDWDT
jgi:hypothetical protein